MTIEELIVSTVQNSTNLPCYHNKFTKTDKTYCVYNYIVTNEHFDNKAIFKTYQIMVHLVAPYGTELYALKSKLKLDLQSAGFIYPTETDASDEDSQHFVLETQKWWQVDYGNS